MHKSKAFTAILPSVNAASDRVAAVDGPGDSGSTLSSFGGKMNSTGVLDGHAESNAGGGPTPDRHRHPDEARLYGGKIVSYHGFRTRPAGVWPLKTLSVTLAQLPLTSHLPVELSLI
jgi:hypothetical protein